MKFLTISFTVLLAAALLLSCTEESPDPEDIIEELEYGDPGEIANQFELGRAIFYDKLLSPNNSVSCASCHKQEFAFADNVAFSEGINGHRTTRNSMPLQNINTEMSVVLDSASFEQDTVGPTPLFWDGREDDLATMVLFPFTEHREHGFAKLAELEEKMSKIPYYQEPFKKLYATDKIDATHIGDALAIFVTGLRADQTRFDRYQNTGSGLNEQELAGRQAFFNTYDCNECHQVETPSGYLSNPSNGFSDIGLDPVPTDKGRQEFTGKESDAGKFKIPSLRNVAVTAPYMHDGRFTTLDSVIDHYSTELATSPNLDPLLKDPEGNPLVLNITDEEKAAIIAFLNTLTDEDLLTNEHYANPFEE